MLVKMMQTLGLTLAEMVPLEQPSGDAGIAQQAGQVTFTWVVAVMILVGLLLIGFKKSKRTHLD
jgi:hypothetical protein